MVVGKDPAKIICYYSDMWGSGWGGCKWANVIHMSGKANPMEALKLSHLMVAAAAVGNTDASKSYLEKDSEAAFAELFSKHRPLQLAVISNSLDLVVLILDKFQSILKEQPEWYKSDAIINQSKGTWGRKKDEIIEHLDYAIHKAIAGNSAGMLQLLLDFEFKYYDYASTRFSEVMLAIVKSGSLDLVKVVAGFQRKDVEPDGYDDKFPWWEEACLGGNGGNPQMVRYLLETGVTTTGEPRGSHQKYGLETPLHWIAKSGKGDIAKILIEHGADVNYRCRPGRPTPLKTAAYFGNLEVARILIDAGANVHFEYPLTAVFNCKRREREKVFDKSEMLSTTELLLKHGTSITYQVASAIEQEAKNLVSSGDPWLKGDLDRESVMALVSVAKRLMETVPRWRIPYADFYIRSKEARELFDSQWFERRYGSKRGSARCWPDMYFLSRVLRNVGYGNLRKLIPRKRKYLIADARRVLCWLEDWRV